MSNLPIYIDANSVSAGFPSPAQDYSATRIDLNEHLIQDQTSTYILRVAGDSMEQVGIFDGDEIIVDRGLEAKNNSIVVAIVNNEFTVKRLQFDGGKVFLKPENPNYESIEIFEHSEFVVWGVVTKCLHTPK